MKLRTHTVERLRDALIKSGRRPSSVLSPAYATLARRGMLSVAERQALSRVDDVAELLFLVMAADQQITDTEYDALRGAIRGISGETLNDGVIEVMIETYALRLRDEGRARRLEASAAELSEPAEREAAFAMAAAVALADDQVTENEHAVVQEVAIALGLSPDDCQRILGELETA